MAVAFRSQAAAGNFSVSSHPCAMPAGVAVGDLLIMGVMTYGAATVAAAAAPAGWTGYGGRNDFQFGADHNYKLWARVADGTEGSTVTLTTSGTFATHIAILAYSGSQGVDAFADFGSAQAGATPTVPSVTTTVANGVAVAFVFNNGAGSATPASGWTERVDHRYGTTGDLIYAMEKAQPTAGASGTAVPTMNDASYKQWAYTIAVKGPPSAVTPVADFTGTPTSGTAPLSVTFTDSSTNTPTSWAWDFGDGGTSTSQNPTHSYTTPGTYTVVLVATNAAGSNTKTRTGYVTVGGAPTANFTGTPLSGAVPFTVTFTDSSTSSPTSWAWTFGDGGTSTSQNPTHSYTAGGVYTVVLVATNSAGSNTKTRTGYVTAGETISYASGGGITIY